jgi:RNA polymerase-interacting CarD/CdnL/TRCF family regulator
MTEEGWKSIKPEKTKERDGIELYNQLEGELKVGDKLVTEKGLIQIKKIKSKEINDPKMPLYNFNVSNDNSYIADGYVVHNKGGEGNDGGGGGTYVCTASYANNLITPLDFKALKKYGIKLRRNDKYLMKAYDWFGPKLAAAVKKGKLINFAKHSTSMWKYDQTKQKDVSFKIKLMIKVHKLFTRPIIRMLGVLLTVKEKIKK